MKRTLKFMTVAGFTAALVIPTAPASAAPVPVAPAQATSVLVTAAKKNSVKYTTAALNLRKGIGTKHKRLATIPKGKKLTIKSTSKGWSKVTYSGKTGWVSGKYLSSKASKKATAKGKTSSMASKARSYANKYGCKNAGIVWNSKKLGRGANGTADWYNNDILLRSSMPSYRLEYVTAHECFHLKQYAAYKGDVKRLARETNRVYGKTGTSYYGLERVTDCMTRAKGIKVYNYTSKCSSKATKAAKNLLAGKRV